MHVKCLKVTAGSSIVYIFVVKLPGVVYPWAIQEFPCTLFLFHDII